MSHNLFEPFIERKIRVRAATQNGRKGLMPFLLGTLLWSCGGANAAVVHDYTVQVDAKLTRLAVTARFGKPIYRARARSNDARDVLIEATDCDTNRKIYVRGKTMFSTNGIQCLSYSVDLERAARNERRNLSLSPGNFIVSPAVWLWRPSFGPDTEILVHFDLPDGVGISVPWRDEGNNVYRIDLSPESANAPAVFGQFEYHEVSVPTATLRVSLVKSEPAMDSDVILKWLRAAAMDVTLAYGRFPNSSPQIVVLPSRDRGSAWAREERSPSAVRFGRVVRDGGESVELFVNQSMPLESFLADWTATHEFSHLMLPYVSRKHKWISEGFAQYYQNVLLARSGAYDPRKAWQKLYDGLERGRRSGPDLSPNMAAAGSLRNGLMKVYWSGAALALMADVTLRQRSDGEESLDLALDRLQACCLPAADVWTGPELMQKLDALLSEPVFMPLYRRHADTVGFPDVSKFLAQLGVHIKDDVVDLRNDADLADIRRSITELDPETARWRQNLATN